jgi:protein-tyrosine phosphatase
MAEAMLRNAAGDLGIRVRSAGTRALVGRPMPRRARVLSIRSGAPKAEVRAHRARWLDDADLADVQLLLGMSRSHVEACTARAPGLMRRSFTAREFARLSAGLSDGLIREAADAAGDDPVARVGALTRLLDSRRPLSAAVSAGDDDVIDPYLAGRRAYDASAAQLVLAIEEIARALRVTLR